MKVEKDVKGNPMPCSVYVDGYLKTNLDELNQLVINDWDGVGFLIGYEGDGKSSLAFQIALYLDAGFTLDQIVFNKDQFEEAVDKAPPGTCIVWDESDELGASWQSGLLQAMKRKFKRIRSKNLFILLVTPTIFDLNKYFVIHRTRFVIEVYSKGIERGFFKFFNRSRKKTLYIKGKKEWDMNVVKSNFFGSFTKLPVGFPIDMEEYNTKKDRAMQDNIQPQPGVRKDQVIKEYRKGCVSRYSIACDQAKIPLLHKKQLGYVFDISPDRVFREN